MPEIPETVRETLRPYLAQVQKLFGDALEAVILYGSAAGGEYVPGKSNINLLVLLTTQDTELLKQYAALHKRWQKEQIVVPLFLTQAELRSSLELFPLEYLEIREQHILLAGRDPFPELRIERGLWRSGTPEEKRVEDLAETTPWSQIEGGMAVMLGIPILVFRERGVGGGIFDIGPNEVGVYQVFVDDDPTSKVFLSPFSNWCSDAREHSRSR